MRMRNRAAKVGILFLLCFMATTFAIAALVEENEGTPTNTALEKANYLTADEVAYIRPGLTISIVDITIPADRKPLVTVKYTDAMGQPLDRLGVLTPGAISSSFILAYLPASQRGEVTDYVAYTTRTQKSPITGVTAIQGGADSATGAVWTPIGDGLYTYKFSKSDRSHVVL